jgi:molybdopterin-containing oxidoreductase family membrane subunit
MAIETYIMGLFKNEDRAVAAVNDLKKSQWTLHRVHSPIPSHKLSQALRLKTSKVGWFTLCGGILGFITGFTLAIFTAERWDLIVSGKPIRALVPFVIVGFEFTVLFAIFGNMIGFLTQTRLPRLQNLEHYDERCSGEHFGVLASCTQDQQEKLHALFAQNGGDVRVFDQNEQLSHQTG